MRSRPAETHAIREQIIALLTKRGPTKIADIRAGVPADGKIVEAQMGYLRLKGVATATEEDGWALTGKSYVQPSPNRRSAAKLRVTAVKPSSGAKTDLGEKIFRFAEAKQTFKMSDMLKRFPASNKEAIRYHLQRFISAGKLKKIDKTTWGIA